MELAIDPREIRLLKGAARAHAELGYANLDAGAICAAAGLAAADFSARFATPVECLIEVQRHAFDQLTARLRAAVRGVGSWPEQIVAAVGAGLAFAAAEPDLALTIVPSTHLLEPRLAEGVWGTTDYLAKALEAGSTEYLGERTAVTATYEQVLIGGVQGLVAVELRSGRAELLPGMRDEMAMTILTTYVGAAEAARFLPRDPD